MGETNRQRPVGHPMPWRICFLLFSAVLLLLVPQGVAARQVRTVSGTVVSADDRAPVLGADVVVEGTTRRTVTGEDGSFTIGVPAGFETLLITRVGFRPAEVTIAPQMTVALEVSPFILDGVVVTAGGVRRTDPTVGYATQTLTADQVNRVPSQNPLEALQGLAAGVRVVSTNATGGTAYINIRGQRSISGSNRPLIIVDNVPLDDTSPRNRGFGTLIGANDALGAGQGANPGLEGIDYGNPLADVDMSNVESITVLKGPAASALYGSRGANGVILITTRSGQTSRGITVSSSLTFEEPLRLPTYQNQYGQGVDGAFQYVDGLGGGLNDADDVSWGPRFDGQPIDQFTGPGQPWVAHPDNIRDYFRTGSQWTTSVAFSDQSDAAHYRLSLSNSEIRGMAPGTEIDRVAIGLRGGVDLTERLTLDGSFNVTNQQGDNRMGTGYYPGNAQHSLFWTPRSIDVNALRDVRCGAEQVALSQCEFGRQYNWINTLNNNPFWIQLVNTNEDERDRLFGHVSGDYRINDWLSAQAIVGRDWYREQRKAVLAKGSFENPNGGFAESTVFSSEINADLVLYATRQLSADVGLEVRLGGNLRSQRRETRNVQVNALTADDLYTLDNADVPPVAGDFTTRREVRSIYGAAALGYRDYLTVELTGRNDWSSTLPAANDSYFYPSLSSSFVFSEAFDLANDWFSFGTFRASWTRVGNDADPYQLEAVLAAQPAYQGLPVFSVPNSLANENLKPEETTAWEFGTELAFLDNRLGLDLTYYTGSTKNQILPAQVSPTTGYTAQTVNAGDVKNWGVEALLRATPVRSGQFEWDVAVNWGKNNSEVSALHGDLEALVLGNYFGINVEARQGEPYGTLYGGSYLRCDEDLVAAGDCSSDDVGLWMLDAAGLPLAGERRVLGNYNPDWFGGISNTFRYGPASLSFLIDGQHGGEVFSVTNWFGRYTGALEETLVGREVDVCDPMNPELVISGVLPDGTLNGDGVNDVAVCPRPYFQSTIPNIHEAAVFDASYLKLREVRIGYVLPDGLLSRLRISSGEVALVGRNLLLWSNAPHIDPETAFDASNVQGLEFGSMPTARSLGFTITVQP